MWIGIVMQMGRMRGDSEVWEKGVVFLLLFFLSGWVGWLVTVAMGEVIKRDS